MTKNVLINTDGTIKDALLREFISNASDALFCSVCITDPDKFEIEPAIFIRLPLT